MRHPIELAIQKVLPVANKPGPHASDAATVSRAFADLLAEAEAVQDIVHMTLPGPLGTLREAWGTLCARAPWAPFSSMQGIVPVDHSKRSRRRS